jgi:hypothetical protein
MAAPDPEYEEYRKFLRFRAMWEAGVGAPEAPAPAAPAATPKFGVIKPHSINYEGALRIILELVFGNRAYVCADPSVQKKSWWLWRTIYRMNPDGFVLIGEAHSNEEGEMYISARYISEEYPEDHATFHIYGRIEGTRWIATRMTWAPRGSANTAEVLWVKRPVAAAAAAAAAADEDY